MSYIELPDGIAPIEQAVISLWFRVPRASLEAAAAQEVPPDLEGDINDYFPAFHQVIPLLTFGSLETAMTNLGHGSGAYPVAPSFIGVDCSPKPVTVNTLAVHLSMSNNSTFQMTPMDSDGELLSQPQFINTLQRRDAFYMGGFGRHPYTSAEQSALEVTPDLWHHILISIDLTNPAVMNYSTANTPGSIKPATMPSGGPEFMWAFDDEDRTDFSLSPSCAQLYNILPAGSTFVAPPTVPLTQITTNNLILIGGGSNAFTGTWEPVAIQAQGNPVALPAAEMFVDSIYRVEMAELQLFTGITVDTSDHNIRRLFVDELGKPVPPETAEQRLDKKPALLLHGSGRWISGTSTGGEAAQFLPTGKIISYSGPRLGT